MFLRVQEASPAIIMYHLNLSLINIREEVVQANSQNKILQNEVNKRDFHVSELQAEVNELKNKVAESENMILHRNTQEVQRLTQEIKNIETAKEFEENRLKAVVKSFESKLDQLTKEIYLAKEKIM